MVESWILSASVRLLKRVTAASESPPAGRSVQRRTARNIVDPNEHSITGVHFDWLIGSVTLKPGPLHYVLNSGLRIMSETILSDSLASAATGRHENTTRSKPISGLRYDWIINLLSAIFVGGLYLDGWAHNHGRVDESFFTPWHAFFYSGYLLVAVAFVAATVANRARGFPLSLSIPDGYRLTGVGLFVFAAGGVGDMVWHILFGIERGIEALFSPTHLLLGLGIGLTVTGPLRAAWNRKEAGSSWRELGPAIASLATFLAALTFFMMFFFPVTVLLGTAGTGSGYFRNDVGKVAGMVGATLTAAALAGPTLLALRRWRLPLGAVSIVLWISILGATIVDYDRPLMVWLALGMAVPALAVDYLAWRARPSANPNAVRWLAPAIPLLLYGGYYLVLLPTAGSTWSVHMWTSTIVIPAMACWLLSFLLVPPQLPESPS